MLKKNNIHFNFLWSIPLIKLVLESKLGQLPLGVVLPLLVLFSSEGLCFFVSKLYLLVSKHPCILEGLSHVAFCSPTKKGTQLSPSSHQPLGREHTAGAR